MEKLVEIVHFLHLELHNAFSSSGMFAFRMLTMFKLALLLGHFFE